MQQIKSNGKHAEKRGGLQDAYQIHRTSHQMVPHTGTILAPASTNQHHTVLLDIVALAGDIRRDDSSGCKFYTRRLSLAGIGLLRPGDADLQAHPLKLRSMDVREGRRDSVTRSSFFPATLCERHNC